jgi:putative transposase
MSLGIKAAQKPSEDTLPELGIQQISEGITCMALPVYPSDLTEKEWRLLAPLIPAAKPGGQPRSADMRRIVNGVFYVLRSGCAWRYLPREYGAWSTVYYYFRRFRLDGT